MLTRGQARRMSQRFADVGVHIPTVRLQQVAAGLPVTHDEWTNIRFALIATETTREQRHAKFTRGKRRCIRWLIVAGMTAAALNLLCITGLMLIGLAFHEWPW